MAPMLTSSASSSLLTSNRVTWTAENDPGGAAAGDNPLVIARARFSLTPARGIAGPGQGGRWRRQSRAPLELGETRGAALIDGLEGAGAEARRRKQASGVLILIYLIIDHQGSDCKKMRRQENAAASGLQSRGIRSRQRLSLNYSYGRRVSFGRTAGLASIARVHARARTRRVRPPAAFAVPSRNKSLCALLRRGR